MDEVISTNDIPEEKKVPKTLDDVYDILVQILDKISTPTGVTLGGTNEGRPTGVAGQVIPSGVFNTVHVP